MKILFCGDRLGDEMRSILARRRADGEEVRGYLSYACQETEPADGIEFLDDVPQHERERLGRLFGIEASVAPAPKPVAQVRVEKDKSAAADLNAGKGPGGRWYVKRGKEIVTGPFETQEAAEAAIVAEAGA